MGILLSEKIGGYCARRPARWLAIACAAACSISPPQAVAAAKPNIIVITSDDVGYNEMGFTSALTGQGTQFETPNLDALAQQSVVARQGYASHSLCSISRAGLLLGQYPQRLGMQDNLGESINDTQYGLPANAKLMPSYLKDLGYTTGMVGKWHVGYAQGVNRPTDMGFDEFYGMLGGGRFYFADFNPAHGIWRGTQFYENQYRTEGDPAKYDPVGGRYVTDAFGEEAVDFINHHANDANPFFLYAPFTASHIPFGVKQADYARFANIADPTARTLAAMTYALDRSIGEIVAAVNNNGLANNTIIVFQNDNGGNDFNDNRPFTGRKGLTYEGSIRVPFFIKMPGVSPGVYDAPINALDVLPTVYAAAGGDVSQLPTDGVDLKPYLTGQNAAAPHETLYWRNSGIFAIRKGDWKLGSLDGGAFRLHNLATDPGEQNNLFLQRKDISDELIYDFTVWEAHMRKQLPNAGTAVNSFDHFVNSTNGNSVWGAAGFWFKAGTSDPVTLQSADSYANLILEFPVRNGGNYSAYNNRVRPTQNEFMLNQFRFTGVFTDTVLRTHLSHGNSVLMVKNLNGDLPSIRLDATSSGTTAKFQFSLSNDLDLLDDLEITGDGTQDFFIASTIRDYTPGRSVTKSGSSKVVLFGKSLFTGDLKVNGGVLQLLTANAAITGPNKIVVGPAGTFQQVGGTVAVHTIDASAGGQYQFTGGTLRVVDFLGNLNNQGGNYSPGASPAASTITGSLNQSAATNKLTMELAGTNAGLNYDQLTIGGSAALGGTLQIDLLPGFFQQTGDVYTLLNAAGGIGGTFANTILPALSGGRSWQLVYGATSLQLMINATGGWNGVAGDYDRNGRVDAADYVLWRKSFNSTTQLLADGDGDGTVEMDDFAVWKANFGKTGPAAGSGSFFSAAVPEPDGLILTALAGLIVKMKAQRRRKLQWTAPQSLEPPLPILGEHQPVRHPGYGSSDRFAVVVTPASRA